MSTCNIGQKYIIIRYDLAKLWSEWAFLMKNSADSTLHR